MEQKIKRAKKLASQFRVKTLRGPGQKLQFNHATGRFCVYIEQVVAHVRGQGLDTGLGANEFKHVRRKAGIQQVIGEKKA